ncbi:DUF3306 domain-containing protein [Bradyrhizobium sp. McL0616]|uniref:DUF3306 domain-containing protein n=1 Tax=Bradyrhizobium sp. McL0616 TaxID=3415674 RepID=UPI003CE6CB76
MTGSGSFVSRWARLKCEAASERKDAAGGKDIQIDPVEMPNVELALGQCNATADDLFDPASLPPLEAITAQADIGAFLQSRVPVELTRAALRRAWASDPAIRDFIGIAENQWDFNDPNAIPGFGELKETDDVQILLRQALGDYEKLPEPVSASVRQAPPDAIAHTRVGRETLDSPTAASEADQEVDVTEIGPAVGQEDDSPAPRRSHGGALPK